MTILEQSLIDYAHKHNLTSVEVGYSGAEATPFWATMHFSCAREGEIPCAVEGGETIAAALRAALAVVNELRAPLADHITGAIEA